MNVNLLIDAIVRQTMVLIAHLATTAGIRSPLAHLANQVFLDLVNELQSQGVGRKVIADMFGIALRTYHAKMQRISESASFRGKTLWEAVYEYIEGEGTVSRGKLLTRFRNDDGPLVRGVLADLVSSGMISKTGRGNATVYRMTSEEELGHVHQHDAVEAAAQIVWVVVHRHKPIDRMQIAELVKLDEKKLDAALKELVDEGRVAREFGEDGIERYTSDACVIPVGSEAGWEAALFDHYQALVTAMCTKLRDGGSGSSYHDHVGGSTYTIDMWKGHPLESEVLRQLQDVRERVTELRERVEAVQRPPSLGPESDLRIIFYAGQTVVGDEPEQE